MNNVSDLRPGASREAAPGVTRAPAGHITVLEWQTILSDAETRGVILRKFASNGWSADVADYSEDGGPWVLRDGKPARVRDNGGDDEDVPF
jgi:hypothetical protein